MFEGESAASGPGQTFPGQVGVEWIRAEHFSISFSCYLGTSCTSPEPEQHDCTVSYFIRVTIYLRITDDSAVLPLVEQMMVKLR